MVAFRWGGHCLLFLQKHANLSTQCGFKRDAWISGCHPLRLEVVREHEQSKVHQDSESAEQTQRGVQQKPGGMFHVQLARHDDTAKLFMNILYWIIKENVALERWNSLKGEKCFLMLNSQVFAFFQLENK